MNYRDAMVVEGHSSNVIGDGLRKFDTVGEEQFDLFTSVESGNLISTGIRL